MESRIKSLFNLCKEQPFDVKKIKNYIHNKKINPEEITRVALRLCDYGMFSYANYLYQNNKNPLPQELITYNWEELFNIFIENGLDASLVICDDGVNYENILTALEFLDDGDLNARILRNILSKKGTPNIKINGCPFFEEVDSNFMMDMQMNLYSEDWQADNAFRFWLVLIGFGGVIKDGKLPVKMQGNYKPDIFKNFEKFDYIVDIKKNSFRLKIVEKATENVVAVV